jgi:hypothetical protein
MERWEAAPARAAQSRLAGRVDSVGEAPPAAMPVQPKWVLAPRSSARQTKRSHHFDLHTLREWAAKSRCRGAIPLKRSDHFDRPAIGFLLRCGRFT